MKNNSNIYDIDGEIIRKAGDNHPFTLDEAKDRVQYYQKKIKELSEKEEKTEEDNKKLKVYETYCKNLLNFEWANLMKMNQDEFTSYISTQAQQTTEEQANKALNDLKNDIETGEDTTNEVSGELTESNESDTNEESRDDEIIERTECNVHEERPLSQSDLLVERDDVNTEMDEYVDFVEE